MGKNTRFARTRRRKYTLRTSKNDQIRAVFIDDIPVDKIAELPKGAVVVQTSSQKFQAHIPLSEPVSSEKAAEIQKTLAVMYGGDIASTDVYHLRRMPGFRNWKYSEPVYAGIAYVQTEGQTLDVVLAMQNKCKNNSLTGKNNLHAIYQQILQKCRKKRKKLCERWRVSGIRCMSKNKIQAVRTFLGVLHVFREGMTHKP